MASQPQPVAPEIQSFLERLVSSRNRDLPLFIPFLLGFSAAFPDSDTTRPDSAHTDSNPDTNESLEPRGVKSPGKDNSHQPTNTDMMVIEGTGIDSMFLSAGEDKGGQPPASTSSVDSMPCVDITEEEDGGDCVVCLDELRGERVVKEMPCQHRFHGECIEKWLGIHGSCTVCRYTMPVEEKAEEKGGQDDDVRRVNQEFWVSYLGRGSRRDDDDRSQEADPTVESESD